jgi:hypothetical protein
MALNMGLFVRDSEEALRAGFAIAAVSTFNTIYDAFDNVPRLETHLTASWQSSNSVR